MNIPITPIHWNPAWRIIPSIYPPTNLFERVADPADLEAVIAIESLTNDRIRDELGELQLVPPEERISGPGTSAIMAAFTHLNPAGSRFSDGSYGVFYAAYSLAGAVAETRYHRERFLRHTQEGPLEINMRVYCLQLRGDLHDVRGHTAALPEVYHNTEYAQAQHWGRTLRTQGSAGVLYRSLRCADTDNAAVFRPKVLSNCRQERHLCYVWDGSAITAVYEKRALSV